jgi:quercetin dioxygenase-like cupin family protein
LSLPRRRQSSSAASAARWLFCRAGARLLGARLRGHDKVEVRFPTNTLYILIAILAENSMSWNVRRVVTGHNADGKAVVTTDEICRNVRSGRPNHQSVVVWSTGDFPADNSTGEDGGLRTVGSVDPDGTVFRIVRYEPGVAPRQHRTESLDYAVVTSGEIELDLDDSVIHLKAGDVLVQRGTIHNWVNRGAEPCVIAFVLIAAEPVRRAGVVLRAAG